MIVDRASGGVPPGSAVDLGSGYIRHVLGFIGIRDVTFIAADGVAANQPAARVCAAEQIGRLAA